MNLRNVIKERIMKIEFNKRELEVTVNALVLAFSSIEDVLKEGKVSLQEKEDLEKERKILSDIAHKLTVPLLTMD